MNYNYRILYNCLNSKHCKTDLVTSRICHTTCCLMPRLMLSAMDSSSRFTVEAMIRDYHKYNPVIEDCEEHLQL